MNTKGVEDGMSDEQASISIMSVGGYTFYVCNKCGHKGYKYPSGHEFSDTNSEEDGELHVETLHARSKLPDEYAIRSATPEELTASALLCDHGYYRGIGCIRGCISLGLKPAAVPVEERTKVLMEALKAVENERLDMHEKYLNPDGGGFADTDFSYSHAIHDAENAIKALITSPVPEERTSEMEPSMSTGDAADRIDFSKVTYFVQNPNTGRIVESTDPYRRDYVSYQDFCVLRDHIEGKAKAESQEVQE